MYSMVTIVNYSVLYTVSCLESKLEMLLSHAKIVTIEIMKVLINLTVVITSQCMCVSSHHVLHFNLHNIVCQ